MLLERLFEKRSSNYSLADPPNWLIDMFGGRETASGEKISETTALIHPDVYACVNVLSDDIAKLPIHTFLKQNEDIKNIKDHPVAKLLYIKPNRYMTPFTFKKLMISHLGTWGNAYALILFNSHGIVREIVPLNPVNTRANIDPESGLLWYETVINGKRKELYDSEVLHFKALSSDGIHGKSPIGVMRENVGAQAAATKYNAKLYKNDATPKGILKVPTVIEPKAKDNVRDEWKRVNAGENIAIIDAGLEYQSISMPLEEAQFIEGMKFNKAQIAMIYKVPLHKLNELDRSTFNNIEQQSIEYVKNTLQPLIVNMEQEINSKLFTDKEVEKGYYVKFNVNSELRGDSESRASYYKVMIESGVMSRNECRALEELSPVENGDKIMASLNYVNLDMMDDYQMSKAGTLKGGGSDNGEGSKESNDQD